MGDQIVTATETVEAGRTEGEENAEDVLSWLLEILTNLLVHLEQVWRRQKRSNHRSFVRRVCDFLPTLKAKRIHLQTNLLGSARLTSTRFVSLESSLDNASVSSFSMDDGIWVEEDEDRQVIRAGRTKYAHAHFSATNDTNPALWDPTVDFVDDPDTHAIHRSTADPAHVPTERSSTPLEFLSGIADSSQQVDPATLQKISLMEEELEALRKQIANLVLLQETNKTVDVSATSVPAAPPPPPPPACPPPPPPPPPPPTQLCGVKTVKAQGAGSFGDLLKQVSLSVVSAAEREEKTDAPGVLNMAAVLKDLGKVKLKPVERSPGGTPLQSRPKQAGTDPASIIAEALKKKFRNRVQYSPDPTDKENENPDFDSPERSPQVKFGQHMLRRTRKRLSLIEEGGSDPPSPSALKDSNK